MRLVKQNKMIPFYKAHGTGNDTIIFLKEECPDIIYKPKFIEKICKRRTGIGADCVIIVSKNKKYDFKMDYYNSDGTWETFCANGARCVAKLLYNKNIVSKKTNFIAGDGPHTAIIKNNEILLKMKPPAIISEMITIDKYKGYLIDSGAKHFVIEVKDFNYKNVETVGRTIRYSKYFKPKGVNVNFYEKKDNNNICVWTYEKGVEKLMLSCGSGSVASAYYAYKMNNIKSPVTCNVLGGVLTIQFNSDWDDVWIIGTATILFESEINY